MVGGIGHLVVVIKAMVSMIVGGLTLFQRVEQKHHWRCRIGWCAAADISVDVDLVSALRLGHCGGVGLVGALRLGYCWWCWTTQRQDFGWVNIILKRLIQKHWWWRRIGKCSAARTLVV